MHEFKVGDRVVAKPGRHTGDTSSIYDVVKGRIYTVSAVDSYHRQGIALDTAHLFLNSERFRLAEDYKYLLVLSAYNTGSVGGSAKVWPDLFNTEKDAIEVGKQEATIGRKFKVAKLVDSQEYITQKEAVPV